MQRVQQGSFELDMDAEEAFPLFSPEGERKWVQHWVPKPVFPAEDKVAWVRDAVFTLERDGERMTWVVVNVDPVKRVADYIYITPSRVARATVRVASARRGCVVEVRYVHTSTSAEADGFVTAQTADAMRERMQHWKAQIEAVGV